MCVVDIYISSWIKCYLVKEYMYRATSVVWIRFSVVDCVGVFSSLISLVDIGSMI